MPVTLRRRWGYSDRCIRCDDCSSSSAMRSNDNIDCPVHSMMLSFQDLRGPPLRLFIVVWYALRQSDMAKSWWLATLDGCSIIVRLTRKSTLVAEKRDWFLGSAMSYVRFVFRSFDTKWVRLITQEWFDLGQPNFTCECTPTLSVLHMTSLSTSGRLQSVTE